MPFNYCEIKYFALHLLSCVDFGRVILETMYGRSAKTLKLNLAQLLRLRAVIYTLSLLFTSGNVSCVHM